MLVAAIAVPAVSIGHDFGHGPVLTSLAADRPASADRGFILKPVVPAPAPVKKAVETYSVQQGDTLSAISARFGLTLDTLRWANHLTDLDTLALDQKLLIPPVNGVLVTVAPGQTVSTLAAKYGVAAADIVEFNLLRDPDHLQPGIQVMVPNGIGAAMPVAPAPAVSTPRRASGSQVFSVYRYSGGGANHFPWGWCTWYVASRRSVPWSGDAHTWYANAQAYGYPTGHTPRVGAIMVTWESGWGHVAYVEAVDGSCWTVSEMNYRGFGMVDQRHICPGQVPLIGFIY
ncbi:MAG TPA: LysM peptidoglycan-binding domain-containing protein [Candidatus Dormibacteraeota bacterium]|nr:LysM peptidoglycan-binding domain-containing protein [Candidatus Dormibacteraeota bacterium]